MPGTAPIEGRPVSVEPKAPAQANSGVGVELREEPSEFPRDRRRLLRDQRIARFVVGKLLVLAAADHPPVRRRADVEIRVGRLPDEAVLRPEVPRLRLGRDGLGREHLVPPLRHEVAASRSRSRRPAPCSGSSVRRAVAAVTPLRCRLDIGHVDRRVELGAAGDRGVEVARGQPARVEREIVIGEERRRRARCRSAPSGRAASETASRGRRARRASASSREPVRVEHVAGQVEVVALAAGRQRMPRSRVRAASAWSARYDRRHARSAFVAADLAGEQRQRRVDLVFDQRRACRRRAAHRPAPVDDDDAMLRPTAPPRPARPTRRRRRPARRSRYRARATRRARAASAGSASSFVRSGGRGFWVAMSEDNARHRIRSAVPCWPRPCRCFRECSISYCV